MMFCVRVVKKALKMWSCIKGALNIAFKEIPYHLKKDFFDHVLNYSYQYLAPFYRKGQRSREEQHDFVWSREGLSYGERSKKVNL